MASIIQAQLLEESTAADDPLPVEAAPESEVNVPQDEDLDEQEVKNPIKILGFSLKSKVFLGYPKIICFQQKILAHLCCFLQNTYKHQKILGFLIVLNKILTYFTKKNTPPQAPDADVDPSALQHDRDDFKTWARGWEEKVYTEESLDPDITLGELLLVYFEWMSVHKACTPHLF
jgi:hypothetical protein